MKYPLDQFCYMELDVKRGCVFSIPYGYLKPEPMYLKNCKAYHKDINQNNRAVKIVLLRCPDCNEEGIYCNNEKASYDSGVKYENGH